eukprot:5856165-Amphidinium_carterae.1
MEWPLPFEGHTLERELEGLCCVECGKGVSDTAGRPRWSHFRTFTCVPKRRRGEPSQLTEPIPLDEAVAPLVQPRRPALRR